MNGDKQFRFNSAWVNDTWVDDVVISVKAGLITDIGRFDSMRHPDCESCNGVALPGMSNVHSHAFQRGIAGLTEFRSGENDSFWTWRNLMYEFVAKLGPEDVFEIAKQLYREMLSAGYTWVGEFHYLHNDQNGNPYANPAELAEAVTRAALEVGIGICLIPTLYQRGGFGRELETRQQRFFLNTESLFEIIQHCQAKFGQHPNFGIGMALHSVRAVECSVAQAAVRDFRKTFPDRPIHVHVAEQLGEQAACQEATGKTPIDYLYSNFDIDSNWCLIHATHASRKELELIAKSEAVIGLCPTTEANLGDGIFPAEDFLDVGGRFAIGSDSHVAINPASELRLIEYGQRLTKHRRAVLATSSESVGCRLYRGAASGGAAALANNAGQLASGKRADLIVIESAHPAIRAATHDRLIDRFVFCEHGNPILRTMVGGQWVSG